MEREQEDNLRHQLDQDFDSLRSLLYAPDPSSTGSNSLPLGRIRDEMAKYSVPTAPASPPQDQGQDYDTRVRELAFDKRAQPKDRTKTEEELALEEKEALEKAERKRRRRMLGEDEVESDEGVGRGRGKNKRRREGGADDLDDDFEEDHDMGGLGTGLGADVQLDDGFDDSDEDDEIENDDDQSEQENSEDSEFEDDSDEHLEAEEGDHSDLTTAHKSEKISSKHHKSAELPFTFPCPQTHEEFLEIVEEVEDSEVPTVVKRIRTLYHPSLAPENKFKLQVWLVSLCCRKSMLLICGIQTLTAVLIDHILYITSPPSSHFGLLASFLPHIFALTKSYPIQSAEYFVEKLSLMNKNLRLGLAKGALDPGAKTWPGLAELSLFRVIGSVWPTSDMNHAVISPTRLLMGAYLGLGRIRSLQDIASGLFLCTLYFQFEHLSKRLVPEVINFLINSVLHLCPHQFKDVSSLPGSFPSPDFHSDLCRPLSITVKKVGGLTMEKPNLVNIMCASTPNEQTKVDLLALAINLLGRFAHMYKDLDGFIELYRPVQDITFKLDANKLPTELQVSNLIQVSFSPSHFPF
jgi:nucleolar protein 14